MYFFLFLHENVYLLFIIWFGELGSENSKEKFPKIYVPGRAPDTQACYRFHPLLFLLPPCIFFSPLSSTYNLDRA